MKILSISTATSNLSVAVNENRQVLSEINIEEHRNHSVDIIPTIQKSLADASLALAEVDKLAVAIGPGSYTGLRIGVTTAKVLADQLNKPVVGVDTLLALAQKVNQPKILVAAILDARNDNFFGGLFESKDEAGADAKTIVKSQHLNIEKLVALIKDQSLVNKYNTVIFVGEFTPEHQNYFQSHLGNDIEVTFGTKDLNQVHAGEIGAFANDLLPTPANELIPKYLRKTQAEVDWEKNREEDETDTSYVEEV